jgi:hypothetical protein
MNKLLTTITLLCFSVAVNAESYICDTVSIASSTPESAMPNFQYPKFIVDVERGVLRLEKERELENYTGFCEVNKTQNAIQCQRIVAVSGKWLFNVDLSDLNFTYSQGYIKGRLEVVSYSGICTKA